MKSVPTPTLSEPGLADMFIELAKQTFPEQTQEQYLTEEVKYLSRALGVMNHKHEVAVKRLGVAGDKIKSLENTIKTLRERNGNDTNTI